jgi:hypothetical protein
MCLYYSYNLKTKEIMLTYKYEYMERIGHPSMHFITTKNEMNQLYFPIIFLRRKFMLQINSRFTKHGWVKMDGWAYLVYPTIALSNYYHRRA